MASSEMKQRNGIELRSEKMRNFIGEPTLKRSIF